MHTSRQPEEDNRYELKAKGRRRDGRQRRHRCAEPHIVSPKPGPRVIVGYNGKSAEAAKIAAALPGAGHRAMRIPMLDTNVIREVAATVERDFGRCDVLVNSAGFTRMVPHHDLEALDDDLIDAIFAANVRGPVRDDPRVRAA